MASSAAVLGIPTPNARALPLPGPRAGRKPGLAVAVWSVAMATELGRSTCLVD